MKINKISICSILVILFYIVCYIGFITPEYSASFRKLFPLFLVLMLTLMLTSQGNKNKDFWLFVMATYVSGFVIQLLGVHTGFIFGKFTYGATLGPKFAEVPILIGVNWVLIIYSVGIFMKEFNFKNHILRAAIGAFLIAILDFLIEPVAIRFDFWNWTDLDVPFQNYVAWFVFSFIMLRLFFLMRFQKINPAATIFFLMQFLFFFALNLKMLSKHF